MLTVIFSSEHFTSSVLSTAACCYEETCIIQTLGQTDLMLSLYKAWKIFEEVSHQNILWIVNTFIQGPLSFCATNNFEEEMKINNTKTAKIIVLKNLPFTLSFVTRWIILSKVWYLTTNLIMLYYQCSCPVHVTCSSITCLWFA